MAQRKFFAIILILTGFFLLTAFFRIEGVGLFFAKPVYAAEIADSGEEAAEIRTVLSTEQAVAYTFSGILNGKVAEDVLAQLHKFGVRGTFFVTEAEMKNHAQILRKIIADGHEVGIAIRTRNEESIDETYQNILRAQKTLNEQFGLETDLVKQPYGVITNNTLVAVKKTGFKLIGHSVNVVQGKHKDYTSADQIMPEIFGRAVHSLSRGQIVHFRMDYYTNDNLIGELMELIKQRKIDNIGYEASYDNPDINPANDSRYTIKPVGQMLENKKFLYQYPVNYEAVPPELRPDAPKPDISRRNFISELSKRYIGNVNTNYDVAAIGFSRREERRLDKTGLIATDENVIFLTFDDWGTDAAVNKLLYVLRKHNVKGTFFVITNNILANPNLLRAIAEEGHDIATHSDKHRPMAVYDSKTGKYFPGQTKEEYIEELTLSYKKLVDIVGDVTFPRSPSPGQAEIADAHPVLYRWFRPPTLSISKKGLEAILENNFEYVVSGSFSPGDYRAKDIPECLSFIKDGIYNNDGKVIKGAVLVMHFSDQAIFTPMALDILLTANAAKAETNPSKFKVGKLSDYLKDGYSQTVLQK